MSSSPAAPCPYCGHLQTPAALCAACGTAQDESTRRATIARMGPWFVRSERFPYMPGCSWPQMAELVARGVVHADSVVRGPTTRQLWTPARRTPGLAHLVGVCHACGARASPRDAECRACRVSFGAPLDRDSLGVIDPRDPPESTHAFDDDAGPPLSSFASNEELREGLHEEVRRRRSLGAAPARPAPSDERLAGAPAGTQARQAGGASPDAVTPRRREVPPMAPLMASIIGVTLAGAALIAIVVALLRRDGSEPTTGDQVRASAQIEPHSPVQAPAIVPPDHAAAAVVDAAAEVDAGTGTRANPSPAAAPSRPEPEPAPWERGLDRVDELLRRGSDPRLPASERSAALDEAISMLETITIPPEAHEGSARALRARIEVDQARRRLAAETFLRGEQRP